MAGLSDIALQAGQLDRTGQAPADIIDFIESAWGLNIQLYPVQRIILKAHYGIALDDLDPNVEVTDWRRQNLRLMTEAEYLRHLFSQGRSNIEEVIPGVQRRELVLSIGRRSGKCKSADSMVVTSRGLLELRELGDVGGDEIQPLQVVVGQEKGRQAESAAFYCNGVRKTKRLVTAAGFTDESTPNHRIKVLGSDGVVQWRYLEDVCVGDHVAINRSTSLWPEHPVPVPKTQGWDLPETVTEEFGLLLGYLVGDGTWGKASYLELTGLEDQVQRFSGVALKVLGHPGRRYLDSRSKQAWHWRFDQKATEVVGAGRAVRQVLHVLGFNLDATTTTKRVPIAIRKSPKRVVANFLRGLFETDGTISKRGEVSFCTASRPLAREVQLFLLNMGVVSCIRPKNNRKYGRTYFSVHLLGARSRRIFYQEIGFDSDKKQARLRDAVQGQGGRKDNKSRTESIPHQRAWCSRLLASVPKIPPRPGHKQVWGRSALREVLGNTIKPSTVDDVTYPRLAEVLPVARQLGADPEVIAHFEHLVDLDYYFDPVVSIEGGECPTFDLNVPDGESFVANGMTNHNTFLCACVVAYEVYKLLLKVDPQSYYGVPKTNTIGLVSVATDKDQAGLLYTEASGHFSECSYFKTYTANNTMSYAKFQTPEDIKRFGRYVDDPTAKATIKVSFKSCIAKGLRGAGNIVIILDELAHFNDVGQSDALKIYRAVKPSLAAFSPKSPQDRRKAIGSVEGRILSISSPLGRQGFFYAKFRQGFSGGLGSQNMLCIQAPSWEVNPTIEATFLAEEYATDATSFFTEYGADFTDRTRGWLEPEHLLACVDPRLRPATKAPLRAPHFMGIDISAGKTGGDYCAVAIGHLNDEEQVVVDLIERIRAGEGDYKNQERMSFDDITDWLFALSRRFYISSGLFDQWAGLPFEMALHKKGLTQCKSVFFTKPMTSQVFQNFKDLMYEGRLVLYDWPLVESGSAESTHSLHIMELLELQAEVHSKYLITVEAPQTKDKYDDMSDALVRMVWEATQHLGKRKYIAGNLGRRSTQKGQVSSRDIAVAQHKARAMGRLGGSSPDRQRSSINRGSVRGRVR